MAMLRALVRIDSDGLGSPSYGGCWRIRPRWRCTFDPSRIVAAELTAAGGLAYDPVVDFTSPSMSDPRHTFVMRCPEPVRFEGAFAFWCWYPVRVSG
jgi:hypothetical protein